MRGSKATFSPGYLPCPRCWESGRRLAASQSLPQLSRGKGLHASALLSALKPSYQQRHPPNQLIWRRHGGELTLFKKKIIIKKKRKKKTTEKIKLEKIESQIREKTHRDYQIPLPQAFPKRGWMGKLVERLSKPETKPSRTENNGPGCW